ncbi:hypothetical protein DMB66_56975 [Actinoplanes sp. ATCC 53533]|uniref:DUF4238 domain-containing protein n=2 Tax=Actinoplanes sp. ATCC 53533 TaxID=1288362 RepID=UPI000F787398|nr:DUF4238 domain-containing protein [Actinoplanes sp. ATCC 53533]RSM40625.1 hypothetical protein DMB66_56975 [Actinoplanes sp. ATCC 53533]
MDQAEQRARFPAEWRARIERLRSRAGQNTPGQHVVSRVILKRFAGKTGVRYLNVLRPDATGRDVGPAGVGKVQNFVPVASTSAEMLWAQTETLLPYALDLCDRGVAHTDERALTLLREAFALHYVRSLETRITHARAYEEAREKQKQIVWASMDWRTAFLDKYGIYPAGEEAFHILMDGALAQNDADFETGLIFREAIERHFEKTKVWLSAHGLEIIRPVAGEFLIGDNPALTVSRDGRLGHGTGEVPLGDADQIFMPIGRHTLLSVGPQSQTGTVPEDTVRVLNEWQVRAASQYVYFHPDSELENFVREVRISMARPAEAA